VTRRVNESPEGVVARTELELRLADPRQLFAADPDFFFETATIAPGVERVHEELRWRELGKPVRLTLRLPPSVVEPGLEQRCADAIRRYCVAQRNRVDAQLRGMLRDGLRALGLGLVLLAIALALSVGIRRSGLPDSVRIFFGDGVFLVAAWVGLWYPLDTLVYSPRPLRRDRAVLDATRGMEVVVQASADTER
jgi:hypothetical protein